jgi:hypothetical protein
LTITNAVGIFHQVIYFFGLFQPLLQLAYTGQAHCVQISDEI